MIHLGDITKLRGSEVPIVDVITGGSPCQDLSVAGKRAGLEGERSGLFMEQIRLVKEMRKHDRNNGRTGMYVRPRYCIWENVPGAFSSNGGKDFRAVLTEFARVADPEAPDVPMPEKGKWLKAGCLYDEMGRWSIAWRVHDAQFWGVPQRRKRIALVADFGGLSAPEILFERQGLSGDFEPGGETREGAADRTEDGTGNAVCYGINGQGGADYNVVCAPEAISLLGDKVSGTLKARDYKGVGRPDSWGSVVCVFDKEVYNSGVNATGGHYIAEGGPAPTLRASVPPGISTEHIVRRLTPLEYERLQGFPDNWTDIGDWTDSKGKKHKAADSPRYKALGNSIALPFWQYLARRICAQYERTITMASLFDGIGGFPLVFERCGAKAVWASEIEEFPMAVTRERFKEEQ